MAEIYNFLSFDGKKKEEEENELNKFQNLRFGNLILIDLTRLLYAANVRTSAPL